MDLVLNLPNDGIRLVFDPVTQRLKVLICFDSFLFIYLFNTSQCGTTSIQHVLVFKSFNTIHYDFSSGWKSKTVVVFVVVVDDDDDDDDDDDYQRLLLLLLLLLLLCCCFPFFVCFFVFSFLSFFFIFSSCQILL